MQASGKLTLTQAGRVSAVPERMPRNQVLSIIVLALAVGALGGWVNHRAQSGGSFRALMSVAICNCSVCLYWATFACRLAS